MSGTDLVLRMSRAALPANRPIDHARRASAALAAGFLFGAVVGMLLFIDEVPLLRMLLVLLPAVAFGLIAAAFWWVWIPARGGADSRGGASCGNERIDLRPRSPFRWWPWHFGSGGCASGWRRSAVQHDGHGPFGGAAGGCVASVVPGGAGFG